MMDREADQVRIKQLLTATIASLCSNSLEYSGELTIQGLLGITIDHKDILLVNINEILAHDQSASTGEHGQTVLYTQTEYAQNATLQPSGVQQNYVSEDNIAAVRQKQVLNSSKSTVSKTKVSEQINRFQSCIVSVFMAGGEAGQLPTLKFLAVGKLSENHCQKILM